MSNIKEQTLSAPFTWASTLEILEGVKVDEVGVKDRVSSLATRSIKRESKLQALNYIVSMCDLTTLEGEDTEGKVLQMTAKAVRPDPSDDEVPSAAAVCVYLHTCLCYNYLYCLLLTGTYMVPLKAWKSHN